MVLEINIDNWSAFRNLKSPEQTTGLTNKEIQLNISVGFGSEDDQLTYFSKFEHGK